MSFTSFGTAPTLGDPKKLAQAQFDYNTKTAEQQNRFNRINQSGPFGTLTYGGTGTAADPYTQTVGMNAGDQSNLDSQRQLTGGLFGLSQDQVGRVNTSLSGPMPGANLEARSRVEDALYSRLEPQLARDRESLRSQLLNAGHTEGSEGYNRALDEHNRQKNDARMQAVLAGGQEQSRLFDLERAARMMPIDELNALQAATPGINGPQFAGVPQTSVAGTDIVGPTLAAHQSELNAFNQDQYNQRATMGALYGLGGSALSAALQPGGILNGLAGDAVDGVKGAFGLGDAAGAAGAAGTIASGSGALGGAGGAAGAASGGSSALGSAASALGSVGGLSQATIAGAGADLAAAIPAIGSPGAGAAGGAASASGSGLGSIASVAAPLAIAGIAAAAFAGKASARSKRQKMWNSIGAAIKKAPRDENGNALIEFGGKTYAMDPSAKQPFGAGTFNLADGGVISIGDNPNDFETFKNYEEARKRFRPTTNEQQARNARASSNPVLNKVTAKDVARAKQPKQSQTRKQQNLRAELFDETGGD